MASLSRHVHPKSSSRWARLSEIVPDMKIEFMPTSDNGGEVEEPMGLAFTDPDGETHVYVFSEEGRKDLVANLTGGVHLPDRPPG